MLNLLMGHPFVLSQLVRCFISLRLILISKGGLFNQLGNFEQIIDSEHAKPGLRSALIRLCLGSDIVVLVLRGLGV